MMRYLVHHHLEAAAARFPERTAVIDGNRSIMYRDLDRAANRVAHQLGELGIGRGDRVGLYLDKSLEAVMGIYGVLKAGAAYVPFDPASPAARLGSIARNAGIHCLVSGISKKAAWDELSGAGARLRSIVCLDGEARGPEGVDVVGSAELSGRPDRRPEPGTIEMDLAYVLYTSGSTGEPKGVMLTHRNALAFVEWAVEEFGVGPDDRLSSHAPFHFDLSVFDLFGAALAGAPVVLVPPGLSVFPVEVARFIGHHRISVWYSVPSILSMLATRGGLRPGDLPSLRCVLFAGEVFPTPYLRRLAELLPGVELANLYGPTETNVCTFHRVTRLPEDDEETIPIGRPIAGVEVMVIDQAGDPVEPGAVGELWVRGPTVMKGYWGDSERTGEALVPNPFDALGDPLYRTGDLVQQDAEGEYRFLGRKDSQIKSRGYRIELGEIETALYAHEGVVECAVVAVPDELVGNRIEAYLSVREGVTEGQIRGHLQDRLPRYMIPETLSFRSFLPRTSTGKVDRRSLVAQASGGRHP